MHFRPFICLIVPLFLAGCFGTPPALYMIETSQPAKKLRVGVSTLLLRDVSLPSYAAAEEISRQEPDGAVRDTQSGLWADDPARAVTFALARQLGQMTTATVASEPWPVDGLPEATLEVRVERMIAGNDGQFHFAGQYFYSNDTAQLRPVAATFDIRIAMENSEIPAIVAAQSQAIDRLAAEIAKRL